MKIALLYPPVVSVILVSLAISCHFPFDSLEFHQKVFFPYPEIDGSIGLHTFTNSGPRETLSLRTMARDNNVAGVVELLERGAPPSYCNRWDLDWG